MALANNRIADFKILYRIIFPKYEKKIDLNSNWQRFWNRDLASLDEESWCDSHTLSMDTFGDTLAKSQSKSSVEWVVEDEEEYEPQSEL